MTPKLQTRNPYPIYCINLLSQIERKTRIEKEAKSFGLEITFIEALTPDALETQDFIAKCYDQKMRLSKFKRDITPGEQACFASHIKVLREFLASDHEYCIVLEDGVEIFETFPKFIDEIDLDGLNFDVLRAGNRTKSKLDFPYCSQGDFTFWFTSQASIGAYTLLYSRRGAEKTIKSAEKFYHPYDIHLGFFWRHNLKILAMKPVITTRAAVPSVIDRMDRAKGGSNRHKKNNRNVKLSNRLRQRSDRYQHKILKYIFPFFWALKARFYEKH